jgi:hypothetical protein
MLESIGFLTILDESMAEAADRHDLVVSAVQDQGEHVENASAPQLPAVTETTGWPMPQSL